MGSLDLLGHGVVIGAHLCTFWNFSTQPPCLPDPSQLCQQGQDFTGHRARWQECGTWPLGQNHLLTEEQVGTGPGTSTWWERDRGVAVDPGRFSGPFLV